MNKTDLENTTGHMEEQQVVAYLKTHIDFFIKHTMLLEQLDLPHEIAGTVSLVERQLQILREKNNKTQSQLAELMQNAHLAETVFHQTSKLYQRWFRLKDSKKIRLTAAEDIREIFSLDQVKLVQKNKETQLFIQQVFHKLNVKFPDNQPQCMPCELSISQFLFSGEGGACLSLAILPLGNNAEAGILLLGSRDASAFKATNGTLFLQQLSQIITSIL